jgi:hypothetical protein
MKENKLTFQFQNLIVDYITFKFQDLDNLQQTRIAKYLFQLGFNSYQESGKLAKPIKELIFVHSKNKFQVSFVGDNSYWGGTLLNISGSNAAFFYRLVQEKYIDWRIFSSAVLSRLDLYYSRTNKIDDQISAREFLQNSQKELNRRDRNVSLEKNSKGFILKIGNRRSNNYFRIYQGKNSLKFEHEMKGKFLQDYHSLLVENRLEEFEQKLSSHFLISFGKLLPLKYSYIDWLVIKLRPIRKLSIPQYFLNTDYLESKSFYLLSDPKKFVMLLQFLTYAQQLDFKIDFLGDTSYRTVHFRIDHFLKFQNPTLKSTSYYKLKKARLFFEELQNATFLTSFSSTQFQRLVAIPKVKIIKSKKLKCWMANIWLVEDLFHYKYPFLLPDLFRRKISKDEFDVAFEVMKTYSSVSIQKTFFIKEFLASYRISNKRITNMKRTFIQLVKLFEEHSLIESNYKIISDGKVYHTDQLTSSNISQGFIVYEKLSI